MLPVCFAGFHQIKMELKTLYSIFDSKSIVKKPCMICSFPLSWAPCRINCLLSHKLNDIDFFMRPIGPLEKITLPQKTRKMTFRYHWLMPWSFEMPFFHLEQLEKLRKSKCRHKNSVKVEEIQQFQSTKATCFWPGSMFFYQNWPVLTLLFLPDGPRSIWEISNARNP